MQTVEDILFACYEEGIVEDVMNVAIHLSKDPNYKHTSMSDIYQESYTIVKRNKPEIHTWESALIKSTEYYLHKKEMIIEFANGNKYKYSGFSHALYESFLQAESKGKFFLLEIRKQFKDSENTEKL